MLNSPKYFRKPQGDENTNWYYDKKMNIPVICRHWEHMILYRTEKDELKSDQIKETMLHLYGVQDYGEDYITCKHCGEPLVNIEFQTIEFTKDGGLKKAFDVLFDDKVEKEIEGIEENEEEDLNKHVLQLVKGFFSILTVVEFKDEHYLEFTKEILSAIENNKRIDTLRKWYIALQKNKKPNMGITSAMRAPLEPMREYKLLFSKGRKSGENLIINADDIYASYVSMVVMTTCNYLYIRLQSNINELNVFLKKSTSVSYNLAGFPLDIDEKKTKGLSFLKSYVEVLGRIFKDHPFYRHLNLSSVTIDELVLNIKNYWLVKESVQEILQNKRNQPEKKERKTKNSIVLPLTRNNDLWKKSFVEINKLKDNELEYELYGTQRENLNLAFIDRISSYGYWNFAKGAHLATAKTIEEKESNHKTLFYERGGVSVKNIEYNIYPSVEKNDTYLHLLPLFYCFNEPYRGLPRIFGFKNKCYLSDENSKAFNRLMTGKKEEKEARYNVWKNDSFNPNFNKKQFEKLLLDIERNNVVDVNFEERVLAPVLDQLSKIHTLVDDDDWKDVLDEFISALRSGNYEKQLRTAILHMENVYSQYSGDEITLLLRHCQINKSVYQFQKTIKLIHAISNYFASYASHNQSESAGSEKERVAKQIKASEFSAEINDMFSKYRVDKWNINKKHNEFLENIMNERTEKNAIASEVENNNDKQFCIHLTNWLSSLKNVLKECTFSEFNKNHYSLVYNNIERFVLNFIHYKMTEENRNISLKTFMEQIFSASVEVLVWEEQKYEKYYDIEYIREAREKAKEEEKQEYMAVFEKVSEEYREIYKEHQKNRIGKFSEAVTDQSKYRF